MRTDLIKRDLRKALFRLLDSLLNFFGQIRRTRNLIIRSTPGQDPLPGADRVAVYVHFDRQGKIADYVIHQLKELVEAGFGIIFVTNSPVFSSLSQAMVAPFCRTVLWRKNVGYDFGAYKDGIKAIGDTRHLDGVLLMNDSVYGPFWKLSDMLSKIDRSTTDFWGITDSWEQHFHIQSYFILFFPAAFNSIAFKQFWQGLPYINYKGWVIRNGELKISRVLAREKLRGRVLAPYWSVAKMVMERLHGIKTDHLSNEYKLFLDRLYMSLIGGRVLNPMHFFWDVLILDYKCPFIKRELIRINPADIPFVWRWPEAVQAASDYDISLIQSHLQT